MIVEIFKRAFSVGYVDAEIRRVERDVTGETLTHNLIADDEIGANVAVRPLADARSETPGQKLRVAAHIGHQIVKLLLSVGQNPFFGVGGHPA